jgi:hypothetical protein
VRDGIGKTVVRNLKVMARMGTFLEDAMRRTYPEFPLRSGVLSWEDYLPPLSNTLLELVKRYDTSTVSPQHSVAGTVSR